MVVLSVTQHNTHLKKKSAEIKPFLHIHHILFHLKMWTAAAGINLSVTNTFASFLYLISVRYKSLTYLTIFVPSVSRPLIGWWRWRNRQRRLGDDAYVIGPYFTTAPAVERRGRDRRSCASVSNSLAIFDDISPPVYSTRSFASSPTLVELQVSAFRRLSLSNVVK